jgi:hypothetical protein
VVGAIPRPPHIQRANYDQRRNDCGDSSGAHTGVALAVQTGRSFVKIISHFALPCCGSGETLDAGKGSKRPRHGRFGSAMPGPDRRARGRPGDCCINAAIDRKCQRYGILPEGILSERVKMIEAVAFQGLSR